MSYEGHNVDVGKILKEEIVEIGAIYKAEDGIVNAWWDFRDSIPWNKNSFMDGSRGAEALDLAYASSHIFEFVLVNSDGAKEMVSCPTVPGPGNERNRHPLRRRLIIVVFELVDDQVHNVCRQVVAVGMSAGGLWGRGKRVTVVSRDSSRLKTGFESSPNWFDGNLDALSQLVE
ncbi:hypothetical protein FA13DRAFT_1717256 [Coprinellus micaceus]|uniref:Uncharacterized protein n=1 Tax=Coprinellus micaceus TaxID=71717 RepID=A0A4Y7SGW4_COPMI|nr:hypothetical protein FA13DRAFT_1717256 [Coprinellus micaceus]